MATEGMATVLPFPERRSHFSMGTAAAMPEVGDVLARGLDEWLVVEVVECADGKHALTLEPMERAPGTRADSGSHDELT
jgi:hypothetical protein